VARRRKEESPVEITLPITPMLDMSFQLLSFFILTFKPMPTEGQISINLPRLDTADQAPPNEQLPDEKKMEYTVGLRATAGGDLALISLRGPAGEAPEIRSLSDLLTQLNQITPPAGKGKESVAITIEADNDLTYSRLIEIMDMCRKAGFDSMNLMPTRKEKS
jgi:biopolymer transport protein ExbD